MSGDFQLCIHALRIFLCNPNVHFLKIFHLTIYLFIFKFYIFSLKILIATYGARVHGSVFKIEFRFSVREFESVETSSGFA